LINDGQFSYTYDSANRLTQIDDGTFTTEYLYNGDGVRIAQIEDGGLGRVKACPEPFLRQDKLRRREAGGRMNFCFRLCFSVYKPRIVLNAFSIFSRWG
jgi:YD repeat-containing protein